jgi:hypothetical protein
MGYETTKFDLLGENRFFETSKPALHWMWNEKQHGEAGAAGARRSGDGLEQDAPATLRCQVPREN